MSSPAEELANYLIANGVGTRGASSGWSVNVTTEPTAPDTTVTLYDDGGGNPDTDELDIQKAIVQVRVRSTKQTGYLAAFAKQEEIRDLLIIPAPLITDNSRFIGVQMIGNIANIGRDDNDRHVLIATYEAEEQREE